MGQKEKRRMPYFRTLVPHRERIIDHQDDFASQQFDQGGSPSPRTTLVRRSSDSVVCYAQEGTIVDVCAILPSRLCRRRQSLARDRRQNGKAKGKEPKRGGSVHYLQSILVGGCHNPFLRKRRHQKRALPSHQQYNCAYSVSWTFC